MIDRWRLDYYHHRLHSALELSDLCCLRGRLYSLWLDGTHQKPAELLNPDSLADAGTNIGGRSFKADPVHSCLELCGVWSTVLHSLPASSLEVVREKRVTFLAGDSNS